MLQPFLPLVPQTALRVFQGGGMGGSPHKLKNVKIPPPHRKLHQIIARKITLFAIFPYFKCPSPPKKKRNLVSANQFYQKICPLPHKILDLGKTWAFQFFSSSILQFLSPSVPQSFIPSDLQSLKFLISFSPSRSFSSSVPQSLRHSVLQSSSPSVLKSLCP